MTNHLVKEGEQRFPDHLHQRLGQAEQTEHFTDFRWIEQLGNISIMSWETEHLTDFRWIKQLSKIYGFNSILFSATLVS